MGFIFQMTSEERRNFLDFMISSVDLLHKKRLVTYEKFKRERIKILKNFKQKNTLFTVNRKRYMQHKSNKTLLKHKFEYPGNS